MAGQQSIIVGITAVLCLFGAAILIYGAVQVRRAAALARRCTRRAGATVVRMVEPRIGTPSSAWPPRTRGGVLATNEAIAAKKRAYQKKRAARVRREAGRGAYALSQSLERGRELGAGA